MKKIIGKPKYIYKYKSISNSDELKYAKDIFINQRIYIPKGISLNDPLEGAIIPIRLGAMGESISNSVGKNHPIIDNIRENYNILSLTSNPESPQMWAHYGNNYKGICIGFRTDKSLRDIVDVKYVNKKTHFKFEEIEPTLEEVDNIIKNAYLYKALGWKYEKEWRIIKERKEFLEFDREEIAFIILGHSMECEKSLEIINIAEKYNIPLYKTYIAEQDYKINILKYNTEIYYDGSELKFEKLNRKKYK